MMCMGAIVHARVARIVFGADQKIESITSDTRNDAHRIIEECMIAANVAAARYLERHRIPALFRVHDRPAPDRVEELRELQREQQIVRSELQTLDPYAPVISESGEVIYSSEQRLAELRQQYLQLRGRYGPEHPDVRRTKREIEAIAGTGAPVFSGSVAEQIAALEIERDSLLERYSPEHPDVVLTCLNQYLDYFFSNVELSSKG